jgi:hypothetical protein
MAQERPKRNAPPGLVPEIAAIRKRIEAYLNQPDDKGRKIGDAEWGVYAFFDYFGEPIYVGQTKENLRTRIRRHLTNQRTDAVAMSVLDPLEVVDIEIWPFNLRGQSIAEVIEILNRAEYTVYKHVLEGSKLKAVLNEKEIPVSEEIALPPSVRGRIVPDAIFDYHKHPDIRIARRAAVISDLSKVIIERKVSKGLRNVLYLQAKRLEWLANQRLNEILAEPSEDTEEGGNEEP